MWIVEQKIKVDRTIWQRHKVKEMKSFVIKKRKELYDKSKEYGIVQVVTEYPLWYVKEVIRIFCFNDDDLYREYEEFKKKERYKLKPVIVIDEDGNETKYQSTCAASKATGINSGLTNMCCNGE